MSTARILCPVDFSVCSKRAASQAMELAIALRAEVELLHVYEIPVLTLPEGPMTVSPEYVATLTHKAQEALNQLRDAMVTQGLHVNTHLVEGTPTSTILEWAKKLNCTLIVMGTHGHTGFRHLLLGSVAERIVRMSSVPVLSVRTEK